MNDFGNCLRNPCNKKDCEHYHEIFFTESKFGKVYNFYNELPPQWYIACLCCEHFKRIDMYRKKIDS